MQCNVGNSYFQYSFEVSKPLRLVVICCRHIALWPVTDRLSLLTGQQLVLRQDAD